MSFIAKNPLSAAKLKTSPPSPIEGARGLFPMEDGWYDIDDNGNITKLGSDSGGGGDGDIASPVIFGETETGFQTEESKAITDYSIAIGYKNISGSKGFYIRNIDQNAKKIYLSNIKYDTDFNTADDNTDVSFETPSYDIGDQFSILGIVHSDDTGSLERHYHFCSTITNINNNVITYKEELPFERLEDTADDEFPVFLVPKKPSVGSIIIGEKSVAEGESNISGGRASHAEGRGNIAIGKFAHAEGRATIAGYASHAEGLVTEATGMWSHSEGKYSKSTGDTSHSEGISTIASGLSSHSEGCGTTASGDYSHSEGYNTETLSNGAHAEGYNTIASGMYSHTEGGSTTASGNYSHSEGISTIASGTDSHAEGNKTKALNDGAHAEGNFTTASGYFSHSEGCNTTASGISSHAEGYNTTASGNYSHSEGYFTTASGNYSHSEGISTIAYSSSQHVQGKYNIADTNEKYAHIVGNGTTDIDRSNAHTLDWNGNAWFAGNVTAGKETTDDDNDLVLVTKGYLKKYIKAYVNEAILGGEW